MNKIHYITLARVNTYFYKAEATSLYIKKFFSSEFLDFLGSNVVCGGTFHLFMAIFFFFDYDIFTSQLNIYLAVSTPHLSLKQPAHSNI